MHSLTYLVYMVIVKWIIYYFFRWDLKYQLTNTLQLYALSKQYDIKQNCLCYFYHWKPMQRSQKVMKALHGKDMSFQTDKSLYNITSLEVDLRTKKSWKMRPAKSTEFQVCWNLHRLLTFCMVGPGFSKLSSSTLLVFLSFFLHINEWTLEVLFSTILEVLWQ